MKPEKKKLSLNENELVVMEFIQIEKSEINNIKQNSGLSNKAWDKTIKSLRKLNLINVEKINEIVYISKK